MEFPGLILKVCIMKAILFNLFFLIPFIACRPDEVEDYISYVKDAKDANGFIPLPEKQVTKSIDNTTHAYYAMPTTDYRHGILGDRIEAKQLVVMVDGLFYQHTLPTGFVFEDIRPRIYDVNADGDWEFITIRTKTTAGAGIAIYKIINKKLVEYAFIRAIGKSNRWLNIVAIYDLDQDGIVELVWVQTPHIGGILKIAKIQPGKLNVIAQKLQYSNHAIGQRNLCLSVLAKKDKQIVFYVPTQKRNKIVGFTFKNNILKKVEEISQKVNFTKPLFSQYDFPNRLKKIIVYILNRV